VRFESHGDECKDYCLLGCDAVESGIKLRRLCQVRFEVMMTMNMNILVFGHGALQSGMNLNIGSMFLRNVGKFLPENTTLHPRI
jgi:hypothetical protein